MIHNDSGRRHFVCLHCRRSVKLVPRWDLVLVEGRECIQPMTEFCSTCQRPLIHLGRKFTTPRKTDDAGWKRLEWLVSQGWRGEHWGTTPNMSLRELKESVEVHRQRLIRQAQLRRRTPKKPVNSYRQRRAQLEARRAALELRRQEAYQAAALASVPEK